MSTIYGTYCSIKRYAIVVYVSSCCINIASAIRIDKHSQFNIVKVLVRVERDESGSLVRDL